MGHEAIDSDKTANYAVAASVGAGVGNTIPFACLLTLMSDDRIANWLTGYEWSFWLIICPGSMFVSLLVGIGLGKAIGKLARATSGLPHYCAVDLGRLAAGAGSFLMALVSSFGLTIAVQGLPATEP